MRVRSLLLAVAIVALAAAPGLARAKGGGPDVRVSRACGGGAVASLRLQGRDGGIRVRFEVDRGRPGSWSIVVVHERRIGWRGGVRVVAGRDSFELERTLADFPGSDSVTARATGPRGVVCEATAVLPDVSGDDGSGTSSD